MSFKSSSGPSTSFNILGFFSLIGGNLTSTSNNNKSIFYWNYNIAIQCQDATRILAYIQVYSPPSQTTPLPDGTVAFVMAKAIFPASVSSQNPVAMHALQFVVLPGDPTQDSYDDHVPDQLPAWVYGIGHVTGEQLTLNDGKNSRVFPVTVGDFVQKSVQTFIVECVYDASSPRWQRTPVLNNRSCVQFMGSCRGLPTSSGRLLINVENVCLNVGPIGGMSTSTSTSVSTFTPSDSSSTPKKRKINPYPTNMDQPSPAPSMGVTTTPQPAILSSTIGTTDDHYPAPTTPSSVTTLQSPFASPAQDPRFDPQYQAYLQHFNPANQPQFVTPSASPSQYRPPAFPTPESPPLSPTVSANTSAYLRSAANPYAYPMTQPTSPASAAPTPITQPVPSDQTDVPSPLTDVEEGSSKTPSRSTRKRADAKLKEKSK
ncbi:hypothetical protein C8J57DRAFT_1508351 [Mycena rebaudengoi]|nr:hypothetical protein C8J57DRAFT_1508351 [Mycena rebaudengoi]